MLFPCFCSLDILGPVGPKYDKYMKMYEKYMKSCIPYIFNNLSRMGTDNCSISQKEVLNRAHGNYILNNIRRVKPT